PGTRCSPGASPPGPRSAGCLPRRRRALPAAGRRRRTPRASSPGPPARGPGRGPRPARRAPPTATACDGGTPTRPGARGGRSRWPAAWRRTAARSRGEGEWPERPRLPRSRPPRGGHRPERPVRHPGHRTERAARGQAGPRRLAPAGEPGDRCRPAGSTAILRGVLPSATPSTCQETRTMNATDSVWRRVAGPWAAAVLLLSCVLLVAAVASAAPAVAGAPAPHAGGGEASLVVPDLAQV